MEVRLVSYTPQPLKVIAFAKGLMRGKHYKLDEISDDDARKEFLDCTRTALLGPFEFVNFVFDFIDVDRSMTHQMVRTRMASYVQESLRFSAKVGEQFKYSVPEDDPIFVLGTPGRDKYDDIMSNIQQGYEELLVMGARTENARGVLPSNIKTSICQAIDYRNLVQLAESRLCQQAQSSHTDIILDMKREIANVEPLMADYLKPSCGHSGVCSWESYLDRPCPLQKIYPMRSEVLKYHKQIKNFVGILGVLEPK